MSPFDTTDPAFREALKDALLDALHENREWLRDLVQEALVEAATAEARREDEVRAALADAQRVFPASHGRA